MAKSFKGVAYWTVATSAPDWLANARDVLQPIEASGLGAIAYENFPGGDHLLISFGEHQCQLVINQCKGTGVVRPSAAAGRFVVALVALKKSLGAIDIVDDDHNAVPTSPRKSHPLFREDWEGVLSVAQVLGLAPTGEFAQRQRALFNQLI
jgi:hypothetical protein